MPSSRNWIRPIFSAISLVVSLLGWIILTPDAIGGQTSYIILIGNSMEPDFKRNDLVLVQPASSYNIGDIVAYAQPDIGTVFHRIIDIGEDGFLLKGDHNSWVDSYHPREDEILGKFWIKIPSAGKYLQYLRKPGTFTLVAVFFAGLILFTLGFDSFTKKKRYNQKSNGSVLVIQKEDDMDKKASDTIYLISAVAFIAIILAVVSFSKPLEDMVADNFEYLHIGDFEYYSYVPENVYEDNILQSGDPIFRQLNNSFNIIFSYELSSAQPASIQGTYRLLAKISEASGWERSIEVVPPSLIVETSFISEGILNLADIQVITDNLEEQTGIFNNQYELTIIPEIIIQGTIGGRDFSDIYTPELSFSFDDQKLILIEDKTGETDVLNPVQASVVLGSKLGPNTLSILGFELNILLARFISICGILISIIAFAWFFFWQKKNVAKINKTKNTDQIEENV